MGQCLNCGTPLLGEFCHTCGQKDEPRLQPFGALVRESAREAFALDSRLDRTVRLLFRRPWFLTQEYIAGRRAAYISPFRLYLLVSVIYFLMLAATGFDTLFFVTASPGSIAVEYLSLLPKLMFVILPAFALLLKLLYPRRLYVEHMIASLHLHAITFIVLTLHTVIIQSWGFADGWWRVAIFFLIDLPIQLTVFVYFFLTLRNVYGGSRLITFVKMLALVFGYIGVLILCGAAIINGERLFVYIFF
jgi:hypothetical protein